MSGIGFAIDIKPAGDAPDAKGFLEFPMTEFEAKEIAERFIARESGPTLKLVSVRRAPSLPGTWSVVFERKDNEGHLVDGPLVVVVDENSRQPRYL